MKTINKVVLSGHLGKEPMIKVYDSGAVRATILLATHDKYKNSVGADMESIQWHRLTAWGRTAEQLEKMVHKGTYISLEGRLHQYKVNKGDTGFRVYHEIVVDRFELLLDQQRA